MGKIGLFYGSDTGCTEVIVQKIIDLVGDERIEELDMSVNKNIELFKTYNCIIIGVPTWYDGDLQSDWLEFYDDFKTIDFTGKTVAIFGLGDQIGYGEYFVDGIGILGEVVMENGGQLIGTTSTEGFDYEESKAEFSHDGETYFMGLALDEDNESDLTDERLEPWISEVLQEFEMVLTV